MLRNSFGSSLEGVKMAREKQLSSDVTRTPDLPSVSSHGGLVFINLY
jgi:hypothetical protein